MQTTSAEVAVTWQEVPSINPREALIVGVDSATSAVCVYVVDRRGGCELSEDGDPPPNGESWPRPPDSLVTSAAELAASNEGL